MKLVPLSFSSILVNGTPSQPFQVSRGIHQGGPLSPSCSLFSAEGLGRIIKNLRNENRLRGILLSAKLEPQTHQQFVDDTMLMATSNIQEAYGLK